MEVNVSRITQGISETRLAVERVRESMRMAVDVAPRLRICYEGVSELELLVQEMETVAATLEDMLPTGRSKRGLMDIGGKALKVLFGVPDADDLHDTQERLARVEGQSAESVHLLGDLTTVTRALSRKTEEINQRIGLLATNIVNIVEPLMKRLETVELELKRVDLEFQLFANASTIISDLKTTSIKALMGLKELVFSLQHITTGRGIDASLMSPLELVKLVSKLKTTLPRGLELITGTDLVDMYKYYTITNVFAHSVRHLIRIFIDIPLATQGHMFQVFSVQTMPVLDQTTGVSTRIQVPDAYFVISEDKELHGQLRESTLRACKGNQPIICPADSILYYRQQQTCLSALYRNEEDLITKLCQHMVLGQHHQPTWIWSQQETRWYYSLPSSEKLMTECVRGTKMSVSEQLINGVGTLTPTKGCKYHTDQYVIFRRAGGSTTLELNKHIIRVPSLPVLRVNPNVTTPSQEAWEVIGELRAEGRTHMGPYGDEIPFAEWKNAIEERRTNSDVKIWAMSSMAIVLTVTVAFIATRCYYRQKKQVKAKTEGTSESAGTSASMVVLPEDPVCRPVFRLTNDECQRLHGPVSASVETIL